MSQAQILARWTKLSQRDFATLYESKRSTDDAALWVRLEVPAAGGIPSRAELLLAACKEAETHGFLSDLAVAVANVERARGRKLGELQKLLEQLGPPGVMQGMTDRARGQMSPDVIFALGDVYKATAIIEDQNGPLGTGFLVRPDLVLTSAHVVLEPGSGGVGFGRTLRPGLSVLFPSVQGAAVRKIALAPRNPAAIAPPHGAGPDSLDPALDGRCDQNLDFALLRLACQVAGAPTIDLAHATAAVVSRPCFVIGYPGGSDGKFDADKVLEVPPNGSRVFHAMNTLAGMSGSACIGHNGRAFGLHEGGLQEVRDGVLQVNSDRTPKIRNRAVSLLSIREHLDGLVQNPLKARASAVGLWMSNPDLVGAWRRKSARLAGDELLAWESLCSAVAPAPAAGSAETFRAHPWFSRPTIEAWCDTALTSGVTEVLFLSGPPGCGKTFAIDILAGKVTDPRLLIRLSPTEATRWSWAEAAARIAQITHREPLRPEAAMAKYDSVEQVMETLTERWSEAARQAPVFIAIDCEIAHDFGLDDATWRNFIIRLAQTPWIRLIIAGLTPDARVGLEDQLLIAAPAATITPVELAHAGVDQLRGFMRRLYAHDGEQVTAAALSSITNLWAPVGSTPPSGPLTTARAALVAMALAVSAGKAP